MGSGLGFASGSGLIHPLGLRPTSLQRNMVTIVRPGGRLRYGTPIALNRQRPGDPSKQILIVGGGLAALAVARLLTNAGITNIVFEASLEDRSQGFSISLRDWGYSELLRALGDVSLRSLTHVVAPDRQIGGRGHVDMILRDNATEDILVTPDPETQPSIVRANRNAFCAWIADNGDKTLGVRYGHKLKGVEGTTGDATAIFENGARYRGSLVIAADGVHPAGTALFLAY